MRWLGGMYEAGRRCGPESGGLSREKQRSWMASHTKSRCAIWPPAAVSLPEASVGPGNCGLFTANPEAFHRQFSRNKKLAP